MIEYDLILNNEKMYIITVSGFNKSNLVTVTCSSVSYIDVTTGECSDEIEKRLGVTFNREDIPSLKLD